MKFEKPVEYYNSNYYAVVNNEACTGCGKCVKRCNMKAIEMRDKKSRIDLDRCIGCGLCVSTCTGSALSLERKAKPWKPPKNTDQLYMKIMAKRYGLGETLKSAGKHILGGKI
jgi:ferredoxin